jgi:topoisomerase-4 subunit B
VKEFVAFLNEGRVTEGDILHFSEDLEGFEVEVALQYNDAYSESLMSFVNCINTIEGGQHETGFRTAFTRVMNEYARRMNLWKKKENLSGEDLREGLTAILSVRMSGPEFEGQTKTKLGNTEARALVDSAVAKHVAIFLEENPADAKRIIEKASRARTARDAARKARDLARNDRTRGVSTSLGGKLTRCASRKPEECELFIVEGDSAGGSAKQGRDRRTQAILPLRGKPLNTERAQLTKLLKNKEILSIIQSIGAGVGTDFKLEDSRYGRVVILADADDDGAHIRCLLLTFLYRYMRPLIRAGRVYLAQPPLFKVEGKRRKGKKFVSHSVYAWSPEEMQKAVKSMDSGVVIQRYKGLGEMNPGQLWDTTLNPETRTMLQVTVEDAVGSERQIRTLMGDNAELRRNWITANVAFGESEEELTNMDGTG